MGKTHEAQLLSQEGQVLPLILNYGTLIVVSI